MYAGARLLALADGMGGHAAGEVASQLVIAALAHLDEDEPRGDLLSQLNEAVHQGNAAIAGQVETDPELDGMGTTLTAILFAGNRLGLVHIGDSRGYLLRDGELSQITKDDTFVQTLVDEGRITAEEAHSHPQRSLIMRALTGHEVEPTLIMREAFVGDRYLLCSDGLSDPVSFDTIQESLLIPDVEASADRLIEMALRGGGPDNVTVVVADVIDFQGIAQTQPILAGAVSGIDDQTAPPNTAAGRASAFNPRRNAPPKRPVAEPEPPPRKKRSRRMFDHRGVLLVLVLLAGLALGRFIIRRQLLRRDAGQHRLRHAWGRGLHPGDVARRPVQRRVLDGSGREEGPAQDHPRRRRPLRLPTAEGRRPVGAGQQQLTALPKSGTYDEAVQLAQATLQLASAGLRRPNRRSTPTSCRRSRRPQALPHRVRDNTTVPSPPQPETPATVSPSLPETPSTGSTPQPKTQSPAQRRADVRSPTTSAPAAPTASPAPEQKPADKPCRVAA